MTAPINSLVTTGTASIGAAGMTGAVIAGEQQVAVIIGLVSTLCTALATVAVCYIRHRFPMEPMRPIKRRRARKNPGQSATNQPTS